MAASHQLEKKVEKAEYEFQNVVSVGIGCTAAWRLKRAGLKRASYPFDWALTSIETVGRFVHQPEIWRVFDCDDRVQAGQNRLLVEQKLYLELPHLHGDGSSFTSADSSYFQRCISRWNTLFSDQSTTLFVLSSPFDAAVKLDAVAARKLGEEIRKKRPNSALLYVDVKVADGDSKLEKVAMEWDKGFFHFCIICSRTNWTGKTPEFAWSHDHVTHIWDQIWSLFSFHLPPVIVAPTADAFHS